MIQIPSDFRIRKYGLDCRLVDEGDVDFILTLRTNKELTKHIHQTEDNRDLQITWLRGYKKREEEGREYYFIFFYQGKPVGLNRLYNRSELYAVTGSWLCDPDTESWIPIAINMLFNEVVFDVLNIQLVVCDVRKTNKMVNRYHKMVGDVKVHESEIDNFYYRTRNTFFPNRDRIIKLLDLNNK